MGFSDWFRRKQQSPGVLTSQDINDLISKSYTLPELMPQYTGIAQFSKWDSDKAVKEGYDASVWVYACVEKRAVSAASVPWIVEQSQGGEWQEVPETHPLARLIKMPNADMDWSTLMTYVVQFMDLAGNSYMSEVRGGNQGLPLELWPLNPAAIKIKPGREDRLVAWYEYSRDGATRRIEANDMIHLQHPNPSDFLFGQSPLKAAGRATDIDREAEIFQKVGLQNRGVSDIAITLDPETTVDQLNALKQKWAEGQGGPRNARKPLWTTRDVKPLNMSSADMDYIEGRRFIRDEICSAFGVPPPMVGNYDNATLANIETARKIFWRDTMLPLLDRIQAQLNTQLASEYGDDIRLRYDTSNVDALRENVTEKVTTAQQLFNMGVPFNVINQRLELGFDDIEGGDTGYLSAGILPVGFEGAGDEPEPGADEARSLAESAYGRKEGSDG